MEQMIIEFFIGLVAKYPAAMTVFMVIGVFRAIFKPLMTFLHTFADATPSAVDNALLDKAEASKFYKTLVFALDYIASIKLPVAK